MALTLTLKDGEAVRIGKDICVSVQRKSGGQVKVSIEAPGQRIDRIGYNHTIGKTK